MTGPVYSTGLDRRPLASLRGLMNSPHLTSFRGANMYKLYWCAQTAAFGPQAVLEAIGVAHEIVPVDVTKDEHLTPEYLAMNPAGKIPALVLPDGTVMHEAAAIMLYLAETHGHTDLAPALDDPIRAEFLSTFFFLTTTVQNAHKQFYYPHRFTADPAKADLVKNQAPVNIKDDWSVIEKRLAGSGPFIFGQRFTLCDIYAVMLITWNPDPKQLLSDSPGLNACFNAAKEREVMARLLPIHMD